MRQLLMLHSPYSRSRQLASGAARVARDVFEAEGLVAAAFRHRTSRAGDPHLHTHVVAANVGYSDSDGRWSALDARHLYRWAQPVGYLYAAHLRHELTERLGVRWGPVRKGLSDLAGVPRQAIDAFSTRRLEIVDHLAAHRAAGGRAAQIATYATRRSKTDAGATDDLRARWARQAAAAGIDADRIGQRSSQDVLSGLELADGEILDVLGGPFGVTERRSTFDRRDVVRAICALLPQGRPVPEIMSLVEDFLAGPDVIVVGDRWTTTDLLACEQRLVDAALAGRSVRSGVVRPELLLGVLDAHPMLSAEQRTMVAGLCRSGRRVEVVVGAAGSGKTSALTAAREAWEAHGYTVTGCALAARAARQLADGAGIRSVTLDRLLGDIRDRRLRLGRGHVVVVDDAGLVGTRQLEELVAAVHRSSAKLVLVGDPSQLPAIAAGGAFAGLVHRLGAHELTENHRQVESWERAALADLRAGRTDELADTYAQHGRIDAVDAMETAVDRWEAGRASGRDVLLLAGRRDQVRAMNRKPRERLQATGEVGSDRWHLDGRSYAIGDQVVTLRNSPRLGVLNGTRGTIVGGDDQRLDLDVNGELVRIPTSCASNGWLDHGYALTIHKAQGLTADECIVLADDTLSREHAYVALSRGRLANRLAIALTEGLTDEHHGHPAPPTVHARMNRMLARSAAEDMAIEMEPDL